MATSSMTTYSNNTISQVEINGTTYDITDATTRSTVSQLDQRVSTLEDSVDHFKRINYVNDVSFNVWNTSDRAATLNYYLSTGERYSLDFFQYGTAFEYADANGNITVTEHSMFKSLILKRSVNSTPTTYSTYENRKISNFHLILIKLYDNVDSPVCRTSLLFPAEEFINGAGCYLYGIHGGTSSRLADYSVCPLFVWYKSNTSFEIFTGGSNMLTGVSIEGIKI